MSKPVSAHIGKQIFFTLLKSYYVSERAECACMFNQCAEARKKKLEIEIQCLA